MTRLLELGDEILARFVDGRLMTEDTSRIRRLERRGGHHDVSDIGRMAVGNGNIEGETLEQDLSRVRAQALRDQAHLARVNPGNRSLLIARSGLDGEFVPYHRQTGAGNGHPDAGNLHGNRCYGFARGFDGSPPDELGRERTAAGRDGTAVAPACAAARQRQQQQDMQQIAQFIKGNVFHPELTVTARCLHSRTSFVVVAFCLALPPVIRPPNFGMRHRRAGYPISKTALFPYFYMAKSMSA